MNLRLSHSRTWSLALAVAALTSSAPLSPEDAPGASREPIVRLVAMPEATRDPSDPLQRGVPVDERLFRHWRQALAATEAQRTEVLVFEITTPGGAVSVTDQMVRDLLDLGDRGVRTVAWIPSEATSAGAILAFACREIVMGPGATLGNCIPIRFDGWQQFEHAPEKVNTEIQTLMSDLARRHGHPEKILRAMVDPKLELWWVRHEGRVDHLTGEEFTRRFPEPQRISDLEYRLAVGSSEALKVDRETARRMGLNLLFASDRDGVKAALGLTPGPFANDEILQLPRPPSSGFGVGWFSSKVWTLLLLLGGIVFLVLAFQTPGIGLFEGLALTCLVAFSLVRGGDSDWIALTTGMLVLGFLLLIVELFFLPGFGVAGIGGILLILLSVYAVGAELPGTTFRERIIPDSADDYRRVREFVIAFLATTVLGGFGALLLAPHIRHLPILGRAVIRFPDRALRHDAARARVVGASALARTVQVGLLGRAETPLRPSGRIQVEGGSLHVVSDGPFIEVGQPVRVVRVEGNHVVVEAIAEEIEP